MPQSRNMRRVAPFRTSSMLSPCLFRHAASPSASQLNRRRIVSLSKSLVRHRCVLFILSFSLCHYSTLAWGQRLAPLAENNDVLFAEYGGLQEWLNNRLQTRQKWKLGNPPAEPLFRNAKVLNALKSAQGLTSPLFRDDFGYYGRGELAGSGSTLSLDQAYMEDPKTHQNVSAKERIRPGDIVIIPRTWNSELLPMVLVYLGKRPFPDETEPRDFFAYSHGKGFEVNTYPPRYHSLHFMPKKGIDIQNKEKWLADPMSDLGVRSVTMHLRRPSRFRPSSAWHLAKHDDQKIGYFLVRARTRANESQGGAVDVLLVENGSFTELSKNQTVPVRGSLVAGQQRSREIYTNIIDQFADYLESHPRYAAEVTGQRRTFCNIFAWDVSRAMNAELAHWIDANGDLVAVPLPLDSKKQPMSPYGEYLKQHYTEVSANELASHWFPGTGTERFGWRQVNEKESQTRANLGYMTVAVWENPSGHGHIAVVRPGERTQAEGPRIAQAGRNNYRDTSVSRGFNNRTRAGIRYWTHD